MSQTAKSNLVAPTGAVSQAKVSQNQSNSITNDLEVWYTTAQMMDYFKVDERTIKRLREKRCIPYYKMGGMVMHPIKLTNELMRTKALNDFWNKPK